MHYMIVHPCSAALNHQMAGGCSARGVKEVFSTSEAEELAGPEHRGAAAGGASAPNGVSSSLLPHWAAFIPALGVGFEGFLWSHRICCCHRSSPPWAPVCALAAPFLVLSIIIALPFSDFFSLSLCNSCFRLLLVWILWINSCFPLKRE